MFGFIASYNQNNQAQGLFLYGWGGLNNGVQANFVVMSSALTALSFNGTSYPISAAWQGKAVIQVYRSSDGVPLYTDANAKFTAKATDSGKSSGVGSDLLELTVRDKTGALFKTVPSSSLQGGNIIVRLK